MREIVLGILLNLLWIIPTVIFAGAPVWVCLLLCLFPIAFGLTLAIA